MKRSAKGFRCSARGGFTRIELLSILFVLTLALLLAMPVLGNGFGNASAVRCLTNSRLLIQAWQTFAVDNNEFLPGVANSANAVNARPFRGPGADPALATILPFTTGWQDWSITNAANTNLQLVIDPNYSSLANYLHRRPEVFKCPMDRYSSSKQREAQWPGRLRSISCNVAVGRGNPTDGPWDTAYKATRKLTDLQNPAPALTFVYLEEHPDSINDSAFYPPRDEIIIDVPAPYHDGATIISFADGRSELHPWVSHIRFSRITASALTIGTPAAADVTYLSSRTPHP